MLTSFRRLQRLPHREASAIERVAVQLRERTPLVASTREHHSFAGPRRDPMVAANRWATDAGAPEHGETSVLPGTLVQVVA
jgi:hypothetical protein